MMTELILTLESLKGPLEFFKHNDAPFVPDRTLFNVFRVSSDWVRPISSAAASKVLLEASKISRSKALGLSLQQSHFRLTSARPVLGNFITFNKKKEVMCSSSQ